MACNKHDFEKDAADQLPRCIHCGKKEGFDTTYVIAFGNPFDGLELMGSFDTHEDACEYIEENVRVDQDWRIVSVDQPQ